MTSESSFNFWDFNIWQSISATGLVVSAMSQAGLHFMDRTVPHFQNVYLIWIAVFGLGTLLKYYMFKNDIHTDHHHH